MKDFTETLDTVIISELDELESIELGSDQYKTTVDGVCKLIDKTNELEKIELEKKKLAISQAKEKRLEKSNEKHQFINYAISIGGILIPVLVTVWGTCKTLRFEETGTVTTNAGKSFINRLFRK